MSRNTDKKGAKASGKPSAEGGAQKRAANAASARAERRSTQLKEARAAGRDPPCDCGRTQEKLDALLKESKYGNNKAAYNAYFTGDATDPRCKKGRPIAEHPAAQHAGGDSGGLGKRDFALFKADAKTKKDPDEKKWKLAQPASCETVNPEELQAAGNKICRTICDALNMSKKNLTKLRLRNVTPSNSQDVAEDAMDDGDTEDDDSATDVAEDTVDDAEDDSDIAKRMRKNVLIAAQNGMGTGKSHLVDNLALAFQPLLKGARIVKVTYNLGQDLMLDASDIKKKSHLHCLLARILLACVVDDPAEVEGALETHGVFDFSSIDAGEDAVARFLHERYPKRPIAIAIDEVAMLEDVMADESSPRRARRASKGLVSTVKHICMRVNELRGFDFKCLCLGFVTALPSLDFKTVSDYPPLWMHPTLLNRTSAEKLLDQVLKKKDKEKPRLDHERLQLVALSGGLPRLVVVMAEFYADRGKVPDLGDVAGDMKWDVQDAQQKKQWADEVVAIVRQSYNAAPRPSSSLFDLGMLAVAKGTLVVPPIIIRHCVSPSSWLPQMFEFACSVADPTKAYENVAIIWDRVRRELELPVVPSHYSAYFDPAQSTSTFSRAPVLHFSFEVDGKFNTERIMKTATEVALNKRPDGKEHLVPAMPNHPGIEAMFFGSRADGKSSQVQVFLHQEKVNQSLADAIAGLNKAAAALSRKFSVLKGRFIYICVVDEPFKHGKKKFEVLATSTAPVIYVSMETYHEYFTPTFAPAAELCVHRHRVDNNINARTAAHRSAAAQSQKKRRKETGN